ncbi:MAG: hypothetical protein ABFS41_15000 [Myxococcota bacterium]
MGARISDRGLRQGCPVCGAPDVACDEVLDAGVLLLAACRRCDHRWTERPLRVVVAQHTDVEIAAAA